jgi:hypothetical protein
MPFQVAVKTNPKPSFSMFLLPTAEKITEENNMDF